MARSNLLENTIINLMELCDENPELANSLIKNTSEYHSISSKILENVPYAIFKSSTVKSININKIIGVKGTIVKSGPVLLKNTKIKYNCLKCNFEGFSDDIGDKKNVNILCESCGSNLNVKSECLNEAIKTQTIRIQDIGNLKGFTELYEINLEGDLVNKFQTGTQIVIAGILKMKWKTIKQNEKILTSLYVHALYVAKTESEEEIDDFDEEFHVLHELDTFEKRKYLLESFTNEIYGYSNVKLGLLLALISEHKEELKQANYTRQISHVLLLGDSGTGKSHFLRVCQRLVNPSIYTNGVGTSNAGLTSCAVKQGKEWALEPGALLLADMGICCIDEFNRLKVNERGGLLEAMEQQTLSVAKAGIISTLNARCSIIAACCTKRQYNKNKSVSENTLISTPLISRFDLIFGLFDIHEPTKDEKIADKILNRSSAIEELKKLWNHTRLKKYISLKRRQNIKISEEMSDILLKYYLSKKSCEGANEFNTIRMLESLVRLAEAHAKLINNECVTEEDVYSAILLYETTINSKSVISLKYHELFTNRKMYDECLEIVRKMYFVTK